jgi:hypothetical protein
MLSYAAHFYTKDKGYNNLFNNGCVFNDYFFLAQQAKLIGDILKSQVVLFFYRSHFGLYVVGYNKLLFPFHVHVDVQGLFFAYGIVVQGMLKNKL